jgi:hypothetical protein
MTVFFKTPLTPFINAHKSITVQSSEMFIHHLVTVLIHHKQQRGATAAQCQFTYI